MKLPELGENIESAQVVSILVARGDTVSADQPVIELETDKATAEVPSEYGGVVKAVHVKKGDRVTVGQLILTLEDGGAAQPAREVSETTAEAPASAPGAFAGRGNQAEEGRPIAPAVPSIRTSAAPVPPPTSPEAEPRPAGRAPTGTPAAAAPSVRWLARELGIDIHDLRGTGPGGRISTGDVKNHARQIIAGRGAAGTAAPDHLDRRGAPRREPMSKIRRATARQMARAWSQVPHVTQFDRADITALEAFRKGHADRARAAGGKLTMTTIIVRVAAGALKAFPRFNATLDLEKEEMVYKPNVNIGVAVDTDRGLLVPVLREVDKKSLVQVAAELTALAARARSGKIHPDDLSGAGFTVTNLGGLGTTYFSPIVNWPQVAILGVGRAAAEPFLRDGTLAERLVLPLSISYDHRALDGADAARFLRWMAQALENPLLLLLEGQAG